MTDAADEILVRGADALARSAGLAPTLQVLLGAICDALHIASAAIFVVDGPTGGLHLAASFGLGDDAAAGLTAAVANPAHPIPKTVATAVATFDVQPINRGGPALRSHLPLVVSRDGTDRVLGVLALAHEDPTDPETRMLLQAGADLAAAAIALDRHP